MATGYEDIDSLMNQQNNLLNEQQKKQNELINQQTQIQTDELNREKEKIDKDVDKTNQSLYSNWQKQTNQYGVQAEQLAQQGLANSGYAETTKTALYNTYQKNVTDTLNNARDLKSDYDFKIAQARQQGSVQQAQAAVDLYAQRLQLLTQNYELRQNREQYLYQKERDKVSDNQWQKTFDEQVRQNEIENQWKQKNYDYQQQRDSVSDSQWQKTFDYQKQRDAVSDSQWQKQYELSKKAAASSKSSRSTSKSSGKKSSSSDGLKINGSNDSLSNNTSDSNIAQILLNKSLETADQMVTDAGKQEFLNRMGNAMQRAVSSGKITEGEMENIVKTFPGVKALNNAAITVHAGEVMGFMGENGAGKSTLMNVLGGVFPADSGDIYIEGKKVAIHSIHKSQALGVAFIHQELALEPYLTIAENIFLGREMKNSFGMVSKDKMAEAARPFLERVGLDVDPNEFVGRLSIGQQQMVEIAKSFSLNAKILILDEPTSSLSEKEVDVLFDTVRDLKKQGMGIIFITHKMAEVFQLCDAVTIMRDGEFMGERQSAECSESELISLMVGRDLGNYYVRTYNKPGDIMMEVKNINAGKRAIDCSFQVRSGEILGFYGLVGAGRSELMKAIMGLDPMDSGEIYLNGEKTKKHDPAYMQKHGIALVPESRKTEGLLLNNTIKFNTTLAVLDRFIKNLVVNTRKEDEITEDGIEKLHIKTPSSLVNCSTLSGGNQQKVLLAKWLATDPKILILDEPTRGIDVGAKAEIYTIINNLAKQGLAIILISSEMPEVMNMSDRMMIMREGHIMGELSHDEYDQERILKYAMGVSNNE